MINKYGIPSLLSILDLSVEEIDELVSTAEDIIANPRRLRRALQGQEAGHPVLRALHPDPSEL